MPTHRELTFDDQPTVEIPILPEHIREARLAKESKSKSGQQVGHDLIICFSGWTFAFGALFAVLNGYPWLVPLLIVGACIAFWHAGS